MIAVADSGSRVMKWGESASRDLVALDVVRSKGLAYLVTCLVEGHQLPGCWSGWTSDRFGFDSGPP